MRIWTDRSPTKPDGVARALGAALKRAAAWKLCAKTYFALVEKERKALRWAIKRAQRAEEERDAARALCAEAAAVLRACEESMPVRRMPELRELAKRLEAVGKKD